LTSEARAYQVLQNLGTNGAFSVAGSYDGYLFRVKEVIEIFNSQIWATPTKGSRLFACIMLLRTVLSLLDYRRFRFRFLSKHAQQKKRFESG
jgi:hypothetical protein